ncbi:MAG: hypothetical protein KR126chlam6_00440 [Candidatus Anoxychlamydiales bacterium]|nr:hypothetical protein [Candidatus Anoxychlamydiales bacterium]
MVHSRVSGSTSRSDWSNPINADINTASKIRDNAATMKTNKFVREKYKSDINKLIDHIDHTELNCLYKFIFHIKIAFYSRVSSESFISTALKICKYFPEAKRVSEEEPPHFVQNSGISPPHASTTADSPAQSQKSGREEHISVGMDGINGLEADRKYIDAIKRLKNSSTDQQKTKSRIKNYISQQVPTELQKDAKAFAQKLGIIIS